MIKRTTVIIMVIAIVSAVTARAAEDTAILSYIQGKVQLKFNDEKDWGEAVLNAGLQEGDSIKTGTDSKARIVLEDGASIFIGPLSVFTVGKVTEDDETSARNSTFMLESGKARSNVNKLNTPDSTFEIKTPTAVAGVRGTDFMVEVDPETDGSSVTVFDGEVEVGDTEGRQARRVRLFKDHGIDVFRGREIDQPRKLDPDRIKNMKNLMERLKTFKAGEAAEGLSDDNATAVLATGRSKLPTEKKMELVQLLKDGKVPPRQIKAVVILTRRGLKPEQALRVINAIEKKRLSDGDVEDFVGRVKGRRNADEINSAVDAIEKKSGSGADKPEKNESKKPDDESSGEKKKDKDAVKPKKPDRDKLKRR